MYLLHEMKTSVITVTYNSSWKCKLIFNQYVVKVVICITSFYSITNYWSCIIQEINKFIFFFEFNVVDQIRFTKKYIEIYFCISIGTTNTVFDSRN